MFLWCDHVFFCFCVSYSLALMSVHLKEQSLLLAYQIGFNGERLHLQAVARALPGWGAAFPILKEHSSVVSVKLCQLRSTLVKTVGIFRI